MSPNAPIVAAVIAALSTLFVAIMTFTAFLLKDRTRIAIRTQVLDSVKKEVEIWDTLLKLAEAANAGEQTPLKRTVLNRIEVIPESFARYGSLEPSNTLIDAAFKCIGRLASASQLQTKRWTLEVKLLCWQLVWFGVTLCVIASFVSLAYGIYSAWTKWSTEPLQFCLAPLTVFPLALPAWAANDEIKKIEYGLTRLGFPKRQPTFSNDDLG